MLTRPESRRHAAWLATAALVAVLLWLAWSRLRSPETPYPVPPGGILVCSWNVENLYDDQDNPGFEDEDEDWFGRDPSAFREKLDRLADAICEMNEGRGPDVLAMVEVESYRAVDSLRRVLNARLPTAWHYRGIVFRENRTGRRIAPAVLTRLPVRDEATRTFGIRRTLEARLGTADRPLTLLVSHWTSRVTDRTGAKREAYADSLYRAFLRDYRSDPGIDMLIAGDFNDTPGDPSLTKHLRTTADAGRVREGGRSPMLLNLTAGLESETRGTYRYRGRWQNLDHLVASPGLLDDRGWTVVPESARIVSGPATRRRPGAEPHRFGGPDATGPRGPSDHFAVSVLLVAAESARPEVALRPGDNSPGSDD